MKQDTQFPAMPDMPEDSASSSDEESQKGEGLDSARTEVAPTAPIASTPSTPESHPKPLQDPIGEALWNLENGRNSQRERLKNPHTFTEHCAATLERYKYPAVRIARQLRVSGQREEGKNTVAAMIVQEMQREIMGRMKLSGCDHWESLDGKISEFGGFLENYGTKIFLEIAREMLRTARTECDDIEIRSSGDVTGTPLFTCVREWRQDGDIYFTVYGKNGGKLGTIPDGYANSLIPGIMQLPGAKKIFLQNALPRGKDEKERLGTEDSMELLICFRLFLGKIKKRLIERHPGTDQIRIEEIFGRIDGYPIVEGKIEQQLGWLLIEPILHFGNEKMEITEENVEKLQEEIKEILLNFGGSKNAGLDMPDLKKLDKVREQLKIILLRKMIRGQVMEEVDGRIDHEFLRDTVSKSEKELKDTKGLLPRWRAKSARKKEAKTHVLDTVQGLYDGIEYAYRLFITGRRLAEKYEGSQKNYGELLMELARVYIKRFNEVATSLDVQMEISESGIGKMPESIYKLAGVPDPEELKRELSRKAVEVGYALRGVERVRLEGRKE